MKVNGNTTGKRTIITKGAMFIVWLTFAAFTSAAWAGTYSGGSGTEADPYLISTAEDMQSIGANPTDWDKHFLVTADIDLSAYTGTQFNIIGYYISSSNNNPFSGVFDGNEHIISNFTYTTGDSDYIGVFGYVNDANAAIKNLTLLDAAVNAGSYSNYVGGIVGELESGTITACVVEGGSVTGDSRIGGLVGLSFGEISRCYAESSVTGVYSTGGLVGGNCGTISNCYATGGVTAMGLYGGGLVGDNGGTISNCYTAGSVSGHNGVGGLVGYNEFGGTISNCYATGSVTGVEFIGVEFIGGLVGLNYGQIADCYAEGSVTGEGETGGLVGGNGGTISNCYAKGSVSGDVAMGGLVGSNEGTISNCYAESAVTGCWWTGGLVGWHNGGTISNCYAAGSVSGGEWYTGGLVGVNSGTISNCYATGEVSASGTSWQSSYQYYRSDNVVVDGVSYSCLQAHTSSSSFEGDLACGYWKSTTGGVVGNNYGGMISACFWDVNTSGLLVSAGGEGKTTAEMQMQSTFTDAGWDFIARVWKICEGVDYPRLEWEMIDRPVINQEPDMTTGTSNTISWHQVNEAVEYYAICCSDDNLENVVAESGWVDVNEYTFDGLETGRTYWYAVKARQNCVLESEWSDVVGSMQVTLSDIVEIMLDADSLKNSNMKNALLNKIEEVLAMIDAGLYEDALKKLDNDILKKTDGCVTTGQPDKNDWITTCEAQQQIYPFVIETIDYVNSLMEQ